MSFGLVLMFMLAVFWRPQEWLVPALYGLPILDAVTYGAMLGFMLEWDSGRIHVRRNCPQYFLFAGLFMASLMSHIANLYFQGLLDHWITAFRLCLFGILLFGTLDTTAKVRWVVRLMVFMAAFMAIHALLQQSRGYGFGGQPPIMSWRPNLARPVPRSLFYGIFEDPNDLGQFLATAMPLTFLCAKRPTAITRLMAGGLCYLLWLGIDATWSRGSLIGVITACAVLLLRAFPKRWLTGLLVVCCVLGLGLLPLSGKYLESSAMDRVDFWGQANWAFKTHPLFGVGQGMISEYIDEDRTPHNAFVLCYSELGVFGYFFWFTLIVAAAMGLIETIIRIDHNPDPEAIWLYRCGWFSLAALAGFCASSYFLSRAFVFPLFFLTAAFGAVPYIAEQYLEPEDTAMGYSLKDITKIGIPTSLLSIAYVYVSIILINKTR
jgi:putative inorganic carbon (hco3(-)) transporter